MNKKHWITIILDNSIKTEEIINYIDISYNITSKRKGQLPFLLLCINYLFFGGIYSNKSLGSIPLKDNI